MLLLSLELELSTRALSDFWMLTVNLTGSTTLHLTPKTSNLLATTPLKHFKLIKLFPVAQVPTLILTNQSSEFVKYSTKNLESTKEWLLP